MHVYVKSIGSVSYQLMFYTICSVKQDKISNVMGKVKTMPNVYGGLFNSWKDAESESKCWTNLKN